MRVRFFAAMAFVAALSLWIAACFDGGYIRGECSVTDDCRTWYNYLGGTECKEGRCVCPNPRQAVCCADGTSRCDTYEYECRFDKLCEAGLIAEASGVAASVGSSSGGPIVPVPPGGLCTSDEECPAPVDYRCGLKLCKNGHCAFKVDIGEATDNQHVGDCRRNICNVAGDVVPIDDPSDIPIDASPCTFDFCEGDQRVHLPLPDGTPCPGNDTWVCVLGQCQECSQQGKLGSCGGGFCDWDRCAPVSCNDSSMDGGETGVDCGGPDCRACPVGFGCIVSSDCLSGVCTLGICDKGSHSDNVKNNAETGVDCGFPGGPLHDCADGQGCLDNINCINDVCYLGVCQAPTCLDDESNGQELHSDCGGPTCPPCP